jgi:hypothetical protein
VIESVGLAFRMSSLEMFQNAWRVVFVVSLTAAGNLFAQTKGPSSLAGLVLSEISALDAAPDLGVWRSLHPNERLKNAAYDNEYESQGLSCAASVAEFAFSGGVKATRQAFFYVPSGKPGDPLPGHQDASLLRQCRLLALWYEVDNPASPDELAKTVYADLGASLGSPDDPPPFKRTDGDWGSGYWSPYKVWERTNRRIVLAVDPGGFIPKPDAHKRLLVIARSSLAPRGLSFDWHGGAPNGQPSLKGAAEGARVAHLENPCSFDDGHNNWQGGLIRFGEKLLRDFPASRWKSYIHLTMARTYAAELILTYPEVDLNGADKPTDPEALRRAAITHFRAFLEENRESSEARAAWREAWRLLAGLPPSPIHFACTD